MQEIISDINWIVIGGGGLVAFALGAVWYSPAMFGSLWKKGMEQGSVEGRPVAYPLIAQAVATFLFAWLLVAAAGHSLALAILATLAATALVKANGLFSSKGSVAVAVEAMYVLAQAAIVLTAFYLFA